MDAAVGHHGEVRPLATVIEDTVVTLRREGEPQSFNLRAAYAQRVLMQYEIHDNLNLFGPFAMDPESGQHNAEPTPAEMGDYLEFYAEADLLLAVSACPYGYTATPPSQWKDGIVPARPIAIQVFDTDIQPLGWPYEI